MIVGGESRENNLRNVRVICASALIAGFFMPWVSVWGMGIAGYKIPRIAQGLQDFGRAMGVQEDPRIILVFTPYLIPVLAFVTIVNLLALPTPKNPDVLGLATALHPF